MTIHSKVTPAGLVAAVDTALSAISGSVVTSGDEINEGVSDTRTIIVHLKEFEGAQGSNTDRNTFGGGLRKRRYVVQIDVFSQPRSNLGEDIKAAQNDAYSVIEILESQDTSPAFGLSGVHTFHWSGRTGPFAFAGVDYWGSQFTLEFMCH